MIKKMLGLMLALMMALSMAASAHALENTQPTTFAYATIESGDIVGLNYKGVYNFRGIPYATAKRFQMPEKVQPWDKPRMCLTWGAICPCLSYDCKSYPGFTQFVTPQAYNFTPNEDCQNLNVWTTSLDKSSSKPVIVFIHGGGFAAGSSMELTTYDGHNIAQSGDVVYVSINHRLNVVGSLDLSVYGDEYKYSGNVGMADIVASLEWIRDNIAVFGGNPENVTLVGQSGGTLKVQALMGMPAAAGLFDKVVLQSRADDDDAFT